MSFNDLFLPTFVAGELEIIKACTDDKEKSARIAFINTLMYAACLREIELGNKCWGDDYWKIGDQILNRAIFLDSESPKAKYKKGSSVSSKNIWFCSTYQNKKCDKNSPHKQWIKGVSRDVSHICAACWLSTKVESKHPEISSACPLRDSDSDK